MVKCKLEAANLSKYGVFGSNFRYSLFCNFASQKRKIVIAAGVYIDSDNLEIQKFTYNIIGDEKGQLCQIQLLYLAIRDGFWYNPFKLHLTKEALKASHLLTRNYGYCIEKACLLAACARVIGIPSRLGFANVKNHIGTERLEKILGTDVLVFHGYTELFLENRWIKATPAFNKELCHKLGVEPLEFNGLEDSIFQEFASTGNQFMEYLYDHGTFDDIPYDLLISTFEKHYGHVRYLNIPDFELIIEN